MLYYQYETKYINYDFMRITVRVWRRRRRRRRRNVYRVHYGEISWRRRRRRQTDLQLAAPAVLLLYYISVTYFIMLRQNLAGAPSRRRFKICILYITFTFYTMVCANPRLLELLIDDRSR